MNIRNLVSSALLSAGLDDSDYDVHVRQAATLYVTLQQKNAPKRILMYIGLDDGFVTDFMVSEENLSSVIGDTAYERFINRMTDETYISV